MLASVNYGLCAHFDFYSLRNFKCLFLISYLPILELWGVAVKKEFLSASIQEENLNGQELRKNKFYNIKIVKEFEDFLR